MSLLSVQDGILLDSFDTSSIVSWEVRLDAAKQTYDMCTCIGKTMAENLQGVPSLKQGQEVIMPLDQPIKSSGHLQVHSKIECHRTRPTYHRFAILQHSHL